MFDKSLRFSIKEPLNEQDTELQTYGCRANNPDICKNCFVEGVCAFVSDDKICKSPSKKWKSFYLKLRDSK